MSYDHFYPEDEKEYSCTMCDKPIDEPGVCSYACYKADMLWQRIFILDWSFSFLDLQSVKF